MSYTVAERVESVSPRFFFVRGADFLVLGVLLVGVAFGVEVFCFFFCGSSSSSELARTITGAAFLRLPRLGGNVTDLEEVSFPFGFVGWFGRYRESIRVLMRMISRFVATLKVFAGVTFAPENEYEDIYDMIYSSGVDCILLLMKNSPCINA